MAKKVKIVRADKYEPVGLYDSATGDSLKIEKAVDVSAVCADEEKTILIYMTAKRGRIVQILHPYPGCRYGSAIHFFVDELSEDAVRPDDDTFAEMAERAGMSRATFQRLVTENAPRPSSNHGG